MANFNYQNFFDEVLDDILPLYAKTTELKIFTDHLYERLSLYCSLQYDAVEGMKEELLSIVTILLKLKAMQEDEDTNDNLNEAILRENIEELEKRLRAFVKLRYIVKYGDQGWEKHIQIKHPELFLECEKTRNKVLHANRNFNLKGSSILDFSTLEHLRKLITNQWEIFHPFFNFHQDKQNKYLFSLYIQSVIAARNAIYHHRNHPVIEKMRALVACNDIIACIPENEIYDSQ